MKNKWEKPKLIVLTRGRPEEFVLGTCKNPGIEGPTGGGVNNDCYNEISYQYCPVESSS